MTVDSISICAQGLDALVVETCASFGRTVILRREMGKALDALGALDALSTFVWEIDRCMNSGTPRDESWHMRLATLAPERSWRF